MDGLTIHNDVMRIDVIRDTQKKLSKCSSSEQCEQCLNQFSYKYTLIIL